MGIVIHLHPPGAKTPQSRRIADSYKEVDQASGRAAGILFRAPTARGPAHLMLLRAPGDDHGGLWAFPGGHTEPGETSIEAACREVWEEISFHLTPYDAGGQRLRSLGQRRGFETFLLDVGHQFDVMLNDEHTGYAWMTLDMIAFRRDRIHPNALAILASLYLPSSGADNG